MKTQSTVRPKHFKINDLGNKKELILCENINQITNELGDTLYEYDMSMLTTKSQSRNDLIADMVRLKYTQDDEYALINKGIADNQDAEYVAYRDYVNWCKEQADVYFGF